MPWLRQYRRTVSHGKGVYEIMNLGGPGHSLYLSVGDARTSVGDILPDRGVEEEYALKSNANVSSKAVQSHFPDIVPIQR